ncbi:MAG: SDR family oxidoreductase [Coriobacteriia bacterium]
MRRGGRQCGRELTDPEAVEDLVAELHSRHLRAAGAVADVRSDTDLARLLETALAAFGRVDVWLNNAGVSAGYRHLDDLSPEEVREIVDINVTGTLLGCRLMAPYFAEHGGILVNMAGRGWGGEATPHTAAYAATKAAVASITRSVAAENRGRRMSVHAFVPGMVRTDFYRDMRVSPRLAASAGNVEFALDAFGVPLPEVGRAFVRVASQEPGRVTGKVYSALTPGRTARGIARMMYFRASGRMREPG